MILHSATLRTFSTSGLFACLFLAVFGSGLLQACAAGLKAGLAIHLSLAIPGCMLGALTYYRYKHHWPKDMTEKRDAASSVYCAVISGVALAAIAFAFSLVVTSSSPVLLVLAVSGMLVIPWARISICRAHFFLCSASMVASAALGIVCTDGRIPLTHLVLAALLMLGSACSMQLFIIFTHGDKLDRMPQSGYSQHACLAAAVQRRQ